MGPERGSRTNVPHPVQNERQIDAMLERIQSQSLKGDRTSQPKDRMKEEKGGALEAK